MLMYVFVPEHEMVGPLVNDNGDTVFTPYELAEKFNNYFASAFTVQDTLSDHAI